VGITPYLGHRDDLIRSRRGFKSLDFKLLVDIPGCVHFREALDFVGSYFFLKMLMDRFDVDIFRDVENKFFHFAVGDRKSIDTDGFAG
jgi:hypothetical protein